MYCSSQVSYIYPQMAYRNRDRAELFSRVEKRIKGHRDVLETRNTALNVKHKKIATQCQTVVKDIESGCF